MRKIFTFLSVLFIAATVYIAYGTFQSAQKFEQDSIQRAHRANELSQQIADAQALQQETSSEEYSNVQCWKWDSTGTNTGIAGSIGRSEFGIANAHADIYYCK